MDDQEKAEQDLIQKGLDSGKLSYPDPVNQSFYHRIVPASVKFQESDREHRTSFPDEWLPEGVRIVKSPVFAIDSKTGEIVDGTDEMLSEPYRTCPRERIETRLVQARKVAEREYDLFPHLEESKVREEMIRSALEVFAKHGLKYLFCIMENRPALPNGLIMNKVVVVVRGA